MKFLISLIFIFYSLCSFSSTLVYCSEANPDYFNPQMSISGAAFDASTLLYDRLLDFDLKTGKLIPGLAKKWSLSKDKKTYTFILRKKVFFSPRKKFKPTRSFSADDVLFTFNRQRLKTHPYYKVNGGSYKFFKSLDLQNRIVDIKKINDYKVQFILDKEQSLFPQYMAMEFASIISKEYGDWLLKKSKPGKIDFEPVGTGPYILTKYVKGSVIRYKRNDNYFLKPPSIKKIVFSIISDPSVRFQKIKRKECDIVSEPQPLDIPLMKKEKHIKVVEAITYNLAYLAMNITRPPLDNLKVRKAIAHALNRELYIKAIYKGQARVAETPLPPSLWGHNAKIKSPKYSVSQSIKLLKEAGYEKGFDIELWTLPVSRPYNPNGKKMGELMQADLKKVGINVKLVTYDWSTYIAKSAKGEHDLIQMGWLADIGDPSNFLQILLSCQSISSGANLSRWCNQKYDEWIEQAMRSPHRKASRLYQRAQVLFNKNIPFVPLVNAYGFTAISSRVKNYILPPFGSERFHYLELSDK